MEMLPSPFLWAPGMLPARIIPADRRRSKNFAERNKKSQEKNAKFKIISIEWFGPRVKFFHEFQLMSPSHKTSNQSVSVCVHACAIQILMHNKVSNFREVFSMEEKGTHTQ